MLSFSDDIASVPEVLILQQIHLRVTDICTMQKRNWMVGRPGNEAKFDSQPRTFTTTCTMALCTQNRYIPGVVGLAYLHTSPLGPDSQ